MHLAAPFLYQVVLGRRSRPTSTLSASDISPMSFCKGAGKLLIRVGTADESGDGNRVPLRTGVLVKGHSESPYDESKDRNSGAGTFRMRTFCFAMNAG